MECVRRCNRHHHIVRHDGNWQKLEHAMFRGFDRGDVTIAAAQALANLAALLAEEPPVLAICRTIVGVPVGFHLLVEVLPNRRMLLAQFGFGKAKGVDHHDPTRAGRQVLAVAIIENHLRFFAHP